MSTNSTAGSSDSTTRQFVVTLAGLSGSVREIPITRGMVAIVDAADYDEVSRHAWHCSSRGYVARSKRVGRQRIYILMHRQITACSPGMYVDHADGNPLNNSRSNLRVCLPWQNQGNMRKPTCKSSRASRFKGVRWTASTRTWAAFIGASDGHTQHLGRFEDEATAAIAYDVAARQRWGVFARLNFPGPGEMPALTGKSR